MNKSIDEQTGAKVRKLREQASMSIEAAAQVGGLTSKQYADGETGVRRFSAQELYKLSRAFGVPLSDMFGDLPTRH